MKRRIFSGVLAMVLTATMFAGCKKTPADGNTTPTTVATTTTTTTTTVATTTEKPVNTAYYNRLTGEYDNAAGPQSRPFAIMVANDKYQARPQVGLSKADMFVEAETEGGITRIMAVFSDASRIPEQVAPVRSARTPFVKMAQSLDAMYAHAGGSQAADAMLSDLEKAGKISRLNALGSNGNAFYRDPTLRQQRDLEHSLSARGSGVVERIANRKFRTTSSVAPFVFSKEETVDHGDPCNQITIKMSGSETCSFKYDAESGKYIKYFGKVSENKPHKDTSGSSIEVTNVVVMYDKKYTEDAYHISFTLQSGNGLLCSGGKVRNIQWKRTESGLSFTENGADATFLPGKTYICLLSDGLKSNTVIE
ncbi:MAG: DUF3048 domain-containing protein [Ruminococcaceae bacterium]|nr:DUF3048 domain-containing protein [Oscillospiraceae bacterium]